MIYVPKQVFVEQQALEYPTGQQAVKAFANEGVEIKNYMGRLPAVKGKTPRDRFGECKNTVVVAVRKQLQFETCKPSAHYQLPLVTGCAGMCEYCYLNTRFGQAPYLRVYANVEKILEQAEVYLKQREGEGEIFFEGSATSDPIPTERYTGSLKKAIEYFGQTEWGRFRFVTKYDDVDSLLNAQHRRHTTVRFSLSTSRVMEVFEHRTPGLEERIEAAKKVAAAGYPLGFLLAPVILYPGWKGDFMDLIERLAQEFQEEITFEIILHRYTRKAKEHILQVFPETKLPMEEEERKFRFGQFGYGKYVYPPETVAEAKEYLELLIGTKMKKAKILYTV